MKKVFVALLILLLPLSAMAAMTSISDSELGDVTGQMGISIALVDFNMDLSIANFTYDDTDSGTIVASNRAINYGPGYINVGPLDLKNIYITIAGNPVWLNTAPNAYEVALAAGYSSSSTLWAATSSRLPSAIAGDMLTIDVLSVTQSPYCALSVGDTGILIGIPDMFISLDGIDIDGIYLNSFNGADGVDKEFKPYAERFIYTNNSLKEDCDSLGSIHINGINLIMYSSVAGTTTIPGLGALLGHDNDEFRSTYKLFSTTTNACDVERYYPGNRAYLLITPHCGAAGVGLTGM